MNLSDLETALRQVTPDVFAREAPAGLRRCIVWHAYNWQRIHGDDHAVARFPRVQLDVFWQSRFDPIMDELFAVLDALCLPYDVQDITWEDERQLHRGIVQLTLV